MTCCAAGILTVGEMARRRGDMTVSLARDGKSKTSERWCLCRGI
jgi:hypothetical protein